MSKQHAQILIKLHKFGSVAASQLSNASKQYLRPLLETEVLVEEKKGRGLAILVNNYKALDAFIKKDFPHGLEPGHTDTVTRSQAVSYWRNSKHGDLTSEPVFINAKKGQVLTKDSKVLPIGQLTEIAGMATFLLGEDSDNYWQFDGTIAIVENYEVFTNWQKINIPADIAIWAAGRISKRIIDWLKSQKMQICNIIHCGDYDPVGLDEFRRLDAQIGKRASLYVPSNIGDLFSKYANPLLLKKQSSSKVLERLRSYSHPEIIEVVKLIDSYNGGLEQEILLNI